MGGIMDLANATTNFALRFTGMQIPQLPRPCLLVWCAYRANCGHLLPCCELALARMLPVSTTSTFSSPQTPIIAR